MASGPRCQHHQSHDTRALVVVVVIMSCSRGSHVASCHSGCVVWWLWLHGLVVVVVVAWWQQWWSHHVMVAVAWLWWQSRHGGGGGHVMLQWLHGMVVVGSHMAW